MDVLDNGERVCSRQVLTFVQSLTDRSFAQIMGLMFEEDPTPQKRRNSLPSLAEEARKLGVRSKLPDSSPRSDEQSQIQREIKRRTVYSIFILDRYQASGRFRPQNISIEDIHVQLPCSEEDFRFGVSVKTGSLLDPPPNEASLPIASTQMLSIFIRLVEIWGRISRYSCRGGRRNETYPPWHEQSDFAQLRSQVEAFDRALPPKLTFSVSKTSAHIAGGTITLYTAIHTLYSLCTIVLHREWLPFIPLRCSKPDGPLDEPTFEPGSAPEGFWEESARLCFKSARDIMEIVRVTSDRQALVQSPQVGFAVWTAAFTGVYSINFPHMDQQCYMCDPRPDQEVNANDGGGWKGATALAVSTLNNMKQRNKMARNWCNWIDRMHSYFEGIKRDHDLAIRALPGPSSEHQKRLAEAKGKSLREGGYGGGLEEYKLLERELKDFGPSLDHDHYQDSPAVVSRGTTRPPNLKSERTPESRTSTTEGGWAAVNAAPTQAQNTEQQDENHRSSYGGPGPRDPAHSTTYYPRVSNPNSLLSGSPGGVNPPYHGQHHHNSSYENNGHPGQHHVLPPFNRLPPNVEWNRQRTGESALKHLEQINMHGSVDVAMFGGSLDSGYWPTQEWPNVGGPSVPGGGVNFMEAAAAPPNGPYVPTPP